MIGDIFGEAVVAILDECPNNRSFVKELSVMFPKVFIETEGNLKELPKVQIDAECDTSAQEADNLECPADLKGRNSILPTTLLHSFCPIPLHAVMAIGRKIPVVLSP